MMIPLPRVGCISFLGQHEKGIKILKMFRVCVGLLFFIAVIVFGVVVSLCLVDSVCWRRRARYLDIWKIFISSLYMSTPPRRFLFIQPLQSLLDLDRGDGDDDEDADGDDNGDVNLLSGALSVHPEPDCVDGNTDHRRARHDVAERMSPPD